MIDEDLFIGNEIISNDFLFGNKKADTRKKYYQYIRCDECEHAKEYEKDNRYVRCGKYPRMISLKDCTCKSAKRKD